MKFRSKTNYLVFVVLVSFLMAGCASFKRNQLPEVGQLLPPAAGVKKPDVTYKFSSGVDFFGKKEHHESIRKQLENEFIHVLRESGYFATLTDGGEWKDIHINVRLVNSGNPAAVIPAVITGLSFYTIPSWATDKFEVTAKATTSDGKEHTYNLTDSSTFVQWLPMIFAFPFNNPAKVPVEVRKNIYKNLILKMLEDGVLPKSEKRTETSSMRIIIESGTSGIAVCILSA